jgi:hypothetical protein
MLLSCKSLVNRVAGMHLILMVRYYGEKLIYLSQWNCTHLPLKVVT